MEKLKSYCNTLSEREKQSEKILAVYTKKNNFIQKIQNLKSIRKRVMGEYQI